jgi:hypothetical protein
MAIQLTLASFAVAARKLRRDGSASSMDIPGSCWMVADLSVRRGMGATILADFAADRRHQAILQSVINSGCWKCGQVTTLSRPLALGSLGSPSAVFRLKLEAPVLGVPT